MKAHNLFTEKKEEKTRLIDEIHLRASFPIQAEEPFSLAAGAIRDWWNIHQGNQLNTSDSNTEENKKELGGKKLCK